MSGLLRLVRIAVVIAAGVGAWFGYEHYAAAESPDDATEVTEAVDGGPAPTSPAPWASLGLVVADTAWDGPTYTSLQPPDDVVRQAMAFDPASARTKLTLFDSEGAVYREVEVDADEVYIRTDGATWETPTADSSLSPTALRDAAFAAPVPTLIDLVPEVVWPYAEVLSDASGGDAASPNHMLVIRIYGGAFAAAEPAVAAQWRANAYFGGQMGRVDIEVEIDAEGHVVGARNLAPDLDVQFRYEPLDVAPTFAAPFVD